MRYFVYMSQAKVQQLFAQIPQRERSNLAAKLSVELPRAEDDGAAGAPTESALTKLSLIEEYLSDAGAVGSVDQPLSYFAGEMSLAWGPYGFNWDEPEAPFVYFGGRTDRTILGLGGSRQHVIGQTGPAHPHSHSATPALMQSLSVWLGEPSRDAKDQEGRVRPAHPLSAVELASSQIGGPWERMQFLAKQLVAGKTSQVWWNSGDGAGFEKLKGEYQVLLGTPLFVAQT